MLLPFCVYKQTQTKLASKKKKKKGQHPSRLPESWIILPPPNTHTHKRHTAHSGSHYRLGLLTLVSVTIMNYFINIIFIVFLVRKSYFFAKNINKFLIESRYVVVFFYYHFYLVSVVSVYLCFVFVFLFIIINFKLYPLLYFILLSFQHFLILKHSFFQFLVQNSVAAKWKASRQLKFESESNF